MTKAEEYRRQAAECEEQAKLARDPQHAEEYRRIAAQWLRMADRAERNNR